MELGESEFHIIPQNWKQKCSIRWKLYSISLLPILRIQIMEHITIQFHPIIFHQTKHTIELRKT